MPWTHSAPLWLLLSCAQPAEDTETIPVEPVPDCVSLSPDELTLGTSVLGVDPIPRAVVEVRSGCDQTLWLDLSGAEPPLDASLSSRELRPGGTVDLAVEVHAQGPEQVAQTLRITPDEAQRVGLSVTAEVLAPVVELEPAALDLGSPWVGCEASTNLTLRNRGTADLVVESMEVRSDSDELVLDLHTEQLGELPWTLEPGRPATVEVRYLGVDEGADEGVVAMGTRHLGEHQVPVSATAVAQDLREDEWVLAERPPVDVVITAYRYLEFYLFVGIIEDELAALVAALWDSGLDPRLLAVIEEQGGCALGDVPWVDRGTSEAEAAAALFAMLDMSEEIPHIVRPEEGCILAAEALDQGDPGECNEGFLREGASLNLAHLSTEPSEGSVWTCVGQIFADHGLDGAAHVIGGKSAACSDFGYAADAPVSWVAAATATGGSYQDLCSEGWGESLAEALVLHPIYTGTFALEHAPWTPSLVVSVDDAVAEAWAWDEAAGAVVFTEGSHPAPGATVRISYVVPPSCD